MSTTSLAIQQELVRRLNPDLYCDPVGTATGGSTTTLIDTGNTIYSSLNANALDGYDVFQEAAGEISHVTRGGAAGSTGTLTLSPAVTTFGTSTPGYQISETSIRVIQDSIKSVLRNLYVPSFFPLSKFILTSDNNDFEQATASPVTGLGTDQNCTSSAVTSPYFNGAQAMQVADDGSGGGYAHAQNMYVNEGMNLYAAVMAAAASGGSSSFAIWNSTTAVIDTATTDELAWGELVLPFTVPTDCETLVARFIGNTASVNAFFDDFQIWESGDGVYPLPSWLRYESQLLDVREFPQGTGGPGTNDYRANERRSRTLDYTVERKDVRGTSEFHLAVRCGQSRPYIYAKRPLAEPSSWTTSGTSTVYAELDEIVEHCLFIIKEPDRADRYLAELRHASLGDAKMYAPSRMYSQ